MIGKAVEMKREIRDGKRQKRADWLCRIVLRNAGEGAQSRLTFAFRKFDARRSTLFSATDSDV